MDLLLSLIMVILGTIGLYLIFGVSFFWNNLYKQPIPTTIIGVIWTSLCLYLILSLSWIGVIIAVILLFLAIQVKSLMKPKPDYSSTPLLKDSISPKDMVVMQKAIEDLEKGSKDPEK